MRKALLTAGVLLLLAIVGIAAFLWYIRPEEKLDLSYRNLSVLDKIGEMVRKRELTVELSDEELGDLVRKAIAGKPQLSDSLRVTGARTEVENGTLAVHINALAGGFVKAGATIYAKAEWQEPNLLITLERGAVKGMAIPAGLLPQQTFVVPLYDKLPAIVGIRDIELADGKLRILLKLLR
ncbi:hypothetical protein [Paenibacillus sp. MBLB4367]|uniref:hypothetical protein n=1 Tax=Paenibacillus sp. MBLB4367 TaxID=3384767 RepID=UPI003908103A